jgi:hypothetical protein
MKTKIGIISIAIVLFAYFIFNTWVTIRWYQLKQASKKTNNVTANGMESLSYLSKRDPYWVMEEKGDTLKVLKENDFQIKTYVEVKEKQ